MELGRTAGRLFNRHYANALPAAGARALTTRAVFRRAAGAASWRTAACASGPDGGRQLWIGLRRGVGRRHTLLRVRRDRDAREDVRIERYAGIQGRTGDA